MPSFLKMSVALRVYAAVCLPIMLTAGLVFAGLWLISSMSTMTRDLESVVQREAVTERANKQLYGIMLEANAIIHAGDQKLAFAAAGNLYKEVGELNQTLAKWASLIQPRHESAFRAVRGQFNTLTSDHKDVVQAVLRDELAEAVEIAKREEVRVNREKLTKLLGAMVDEVRRESQEVRAYIGHRTSLLAVLFVGAVMAGVATCMIFAVVVTRRTIVQPLTSAHAALASLSEGNLDTEIPPAKYQDEIGQMLAGLATFKQNALDLERSRTNQIRLAQVQAAHNTELSRLTTDIMGVVDAANSGDYSRRVAYEHDDPSLGKLADGVNSVLSTVESGLEEAVTILSCVADGDLTRRMEGQYAGAFAQLKQGTNAAADQLEMMIGQIGTTVMAIRGATDELLNGAEDLSSRTTQQATTIEQTTAALEAFARTVKANSGRAVDAAGLAAGAQNHAEKGGEVIGQVQEAMGRIDESSARITDVIALIDDIAFQTNLLALNASVEAARAGEAGRGFAVVAQEVRRLAQRAAEASGEVKGLVGQGRREVSGGVTLVGRAAATLLEIVGSVKVVTNMMQQIATDSKVQADTVGELSIAVRRMDEITQANSFLVEETNGAIAATQEQVVSLSATLSGFATRNTPGKMRAAA